MVKFKPTGICPSEIDFTIEDGIVKNVNFLKGCSGNLQAIGKLVEGLSATEVITKLQGIVCRNGTSCADQLAIALEESLSKPPSSK